MHNYIIELEKDKQLSYCLTYNLRLVKLEMLKAYIETNLVNNFIKSFKLLAKLSNFFVRKLNKNFCFYVNYCSLNNLIIKNQYLFSLISKLFHDLSWAKRFI